MKTSAPVGLRAYPRLLSYVRPYWRIFALGLAGMLVMSVTAPALAALLKPLLDGSFVTTRTEGAWRIPLLLIGVFVLRGIGNYTSNVAVQYVASRVVMDLRNAMFAKLTTLPVPFFDDNSAGELISKFSYDVAQVSDASTRVLQVIVRDSLTVAGLLLLMLYVAPKLTLVVLGMAPVFVFIVLKVSKRLRAMSRKVQLSMGEISRVAEETIEGQKVVKIYGGQDYERERFHTAANNVRRFHMKVVGTASANTPIVQVVVAIGLAVVIYLASQLAAAHELSAGAFITFCSAMAMLLTPAERLAGVNEHLQRGMAAAESVFALIDQPIEPDPGKHDLGRAQGRVAMRTVSFGYQADRAPAIDQVSLDIAPGETLALVGASGSGKTTLINLIARFYQPSAGQILIDGVDIENIRLASLRENIALVSQEVVLFNDTIYNNIAYGSLRTRSRSEVEAAAKSAHIIEFIDKFPDGMETMIGESGLKLSGGQRQRLAIARAILKDAPILILDEATSALDSKSERYIQEAIEVVRQGRTCIIIAHRLSTVKNADRIVVLEHGRIVESGTHAELITHNGVYRRLHRSHYFDEASQTEPSPSMISPENLPA